MHSIGTIGYETQILRNIFEVYLLWLNRIYMLGQWDEQWYQKEIQHCNQYEQNELPFEESWYQRRVTRQNSNIFSLQKEWI